MQWLCDDSSCAINSPCVCFPVAGPTPACTLPTFDVPPALEPPTLARPGTRQRASSFL